MTKPTEATLRADFATVYRCLKRERAMRAKVFSGKPETLKTKLEEIDAALAALERLKDAAKAALPQQQPLLIDKVRERQANGY